MGYTSISSFSFVANETAVSSSMSIRLWSLKTSKKLSRIWKWKAGVNKRLRVRHRSPAISNCLGLQNQFDTFIVFFYLPVDKNMHSPSQLLRYEYSLPLASSVWLDKIGCNQSNGNWNYISIEWLWNNELTSMYSGEEITIKGRNIAQAR